MSLEGKSVEEIQALAELASDLASDPKTRNSFLSLTKARNPNANIPEIDIPAALGAQFKPYLDKLDALSKREEERVLQERILASRRAIVAKGVAESDVPEIEKLMVDKGIANHETAVEHYQMSKRAAAPTPSSMLPGLRRLEQPKVDMKNFAGDPKAYTYNAAYSIIDELRGRKAAA